MKPTLQFSIAAASLITALAMPTQMAAQKQIPRYIITDLGVVGGPPGQPFHITNNGLISGSVAVTKGSKLTEQAVLYFKGLTLHIGTPGLGGKNSVPLA